MFQSTANGHTRVKEECIAALENINNEDLFSALSAASARAQRA